MRTPPRVSRYISAPRRLVTAAAVILAAGVSAGCTSPSAANSRGASAVSSPTIPLSSSSVTRSAAWATLAMGHLDDPLNTFWQLLTLKGSKWHLATPPGVASNGGLVAAATSTSVLAGFGPSQDLGFSPLARTVDQGSSWQGGVLPAGLALVPDALAQGDGESLALLGTDGGKVVASTADLSTWTPVTTAAALRGQSPLAACHLRSLTAVTLNTHGNSLVGASCAQGGRVGLFTPSSDGWISVGPRIPGDSGGPTEVVRLDQTGAGTAALVSVGNAPAARLYAIWSTNGLGSWTVSAGLPLDGASLLSTGVTDAGGFIVCTRRGGAVPSASVLSPATRSQWKSLPSLPSGTASVTASPAGNYEALVPHLSLLSVYGLSSSGWTKVQSLQVDIPYGSSS
jgi:hypothetical protein